MPLVIPEFPAFRAIQLEDKAYFEGLFRSLGPSISEFTFTNFFIWRKCDRSQVTSINGNVCVKASPDNESPYFFEPIGNNKISDTIKICFSHIPRMSRISEAFVNKHLENKNKYKITQDRDNSDYIYSRADLALLKGKKFDGKRNHINKFLKNNSPLYSELQASDIDECLKFLEKWKIEKAESLCCNGPIIEALLHFHQLDCRGAVVRIGGTVKAFTIGERMDPNTAIVYIEVADQKVDGLAQYINQQFCSRQWADVGYINREQDLGDPGLRRAKLSYQPIGIINKYSAELS